MLKSKLKYRLILASKSPRRQELMKSLDVDFEVRTKEISEVYPKELKGHEIPIYLSQIKAKAFTFELEEDEMLICSDTVVCIADRILEKPTNAEVAKEMLKALSGRSHTVYSAVCLMSNHKIKTFWDSTKVRFRTLEEEEIDYYIAQHHPFDKAGSYGIQDWIGCVGIQEIIGSYYTVMGLPLHLLYQELMQF